MSALDVVLLILLLISIALNGLLYYRWHSYRARPAGTHSHTGMMPKVDRDQILRDRDRRSDSSGLPTESMKPPKTLPPMKPRDGEPQ